MERLYWIDMSKGNKTFPMFYNHMLSMYNALYPLKLLH